MKKEREEIEIKKNTNTDIMETTFNESGWELESVKMKGDKTFVIFVKKDT